MPKVLVVDDDEDTLRMLEHLLRSEEVTCCTTLSDAWNMIDKGYDPHVVILDIHLGGEDGTKFLFHPKFRTGKTRVIIFTCDSRVLCDDLQSKLLYAGADLVLQKPTTISLLEAHVWRLAKIADKIRKAGRKIATGTFRAISLSQVKSAKGVL